MQFQRATNPYSYFLLVLLLVLMLILNRRLRGRYG